MRPDRCSIVLIMLALAAQCSAQPIRHAFIAIDESRDSLVFTDENNPAANCSVHIEK